MIFPNFINKYKFAFFTALSLLVICGCQRPNVPKINELKENAESKEGIVEGVAKSSGAPVNNLEFKEVIVEGTGVSLDSAKKNAFRDAVRIVVGSFIENDILIKNDKIIEENLLEYSGGFVETFQIISESKDKDGLFKVKLKAKVPQHTIVEKLRSMKIDVKNVSGSNLKAQLETQETMKKEGGKLISSIMEEYPKLWQAKQIGEPKIANSKLALQIEVSVDREKYLAWAGKLCKVLEKSADLKVTRSYVKSGEENDGRPIGAKLKDDNSFVIYAEKVNRYDPEPKYLPYRNGKFFAVVRNFTISGNCEIDHFYFFESNPIFPIFDASVTDKSENGKSYYPSFPFAKQYIPNQFNVSIFSASEELLFKWKYKSDMGDSFSGYTLWNYSNVHLGTNHLKGGGSGYVNPLTPFPFIYNQVGFDIPGSYTAYSTKCMLELRLPIDDFDVSKVSKIATSFSIE